MSSLTYEGFCLSSDSTPILDRIDLDLRGPGVAALLGPSGVGKSSLLRATQRLLEPGRGGWRQTGSIHFEGKDILDRRLSRQKLARLIGFVAQKPRMLSGSVLDNVEFALRHTIGLSRKEARARAEQALQTVGLLDEVVSLDEAAWKLSGGQAQRLSIARAIALEPKALLMDEPSSALDPEMATHIEKLIRRLAEDRLIVLVSHDVGLATRVADSAGFLFRRPEGARVIEYGRAPGVFKTPESDEVAAFLEHGRARFIGRSHREDAAPAEERELETTPAVPALQRFYLFVCGGNTSRSPLAEIFCREEIARLLGVNAADTGSAIKASSAGVDSRVGQPLSAKAQDLLTDLGLPPSDHRTRPVTPELVASADAVFGLTTGHCDALRERFPDATSKIQRLDPVEDIRDPSQLSPELFREIAQRIRAAVCWRLAEAAGNPRV
ncbi:MAG: ABC-type phosphate transport system ATPase subunit/protein-tyrosine-phosphatase [Candidatus Binatia bacterium]|jgi:ABC-type phosphate transport system ATPase subunit/protein-tyrosine-phosphatase